VESGSQQVTLSWRIVNVTPGQTVAVDTWRQNGWQPAWSTTEVNPAVGSREVSLLDTQSFSPPTFRLTLYDGRDIIDQRFLVLPYDPTEGVPEIVNFASPTTSIDPTALARNRAVVEVNWQVINRPVNSQLVFEQMLPDGSTVNVEQARPVYYVMSAGRGSVAPVQPGDLQFVTLRLSLVDVVTGEVYDEAAVYIPFTGVPLPADLGMPVPTEEMVAPEATAGVEAPAATAEPTTAPAVGPNIQIFTVEPSVVPAGSPVTLTWNVIDAATVQISEVLPNSASGLTYVQLPSSGSVAVPLPEAATTTVTYVLTATDASGNSSSAEQTVTIGG
jgi:hypothetical protein